MLIKNNHNLNLNNTLKEIHGDIKSIKNEQKQIQKQMEEKFELKIKNIEEKFNQQMKDMIIKNAHLEQYGRRNNLEINGTPGAFNDDQLEGKVIEVLNGIGVGVDTRSIEACHRMPKLRRNPDAPRRVLVRFCNRKDAESALKLKKLKNDFSGSVYGCAEKIFFNENLSPSFKDILVKCKKPKLNRLVKWDGKDKTR